MKFIIRQPGQGYIDVNKWIPLEDPDVPFLKHNLTYTLPISDEDGNPKVLVLWKEAPHHLVIPRETPTERSEFIRLTPKAREIEIKSNIILDLMHPDKTQSKAITSWMHEQRGILNLACGKGKTVVALEIIARQGQAAIVVVNTKNLLKQWELRIKEHLPGASIGVVQGAPGTWVWNKDITLCMLSTLCYHRDRIPLAPRQECGIVVYDEMHHLAADEFSYTADLFYGKRLGLTATSRRGDGLEPIYYFHIGQIFYSDLLQELTPRIFFQFTPFQVILNDPNIKPFITDKHGDFNLSKYRTYIGRMPERNEWIVEYLLWLQQKCNKILAISHSRDQLYLLRDIFTRRNVSVGIATGKEKAEVRLTSIEKNAINLGTSQLVKENLDVPDLDALVLLSPFGQGIPGANSIQQAFGRILRPVADKQPLVIILTEPGMCQFYRMCRNMMRIMDRWPDLKGGKMKYTIIREGFKPDV